jgi:hypothetical protein
MKRGFLDSINPPDDKKYIAPIGSKRPDEKLCIASTGSKRFNGKKYVSSVSGNLSDGKKCGAARNVRFRHRGIKQSMQVCRIASLRASQRFDDGSAGRRHEVSFSLFALLKSGGVFPQRWTARGLHFATIRIVPAAYFAILIIFRMFVASK